MTTSSTLIASSRPPFLLLTPAVLSLSFAISYWQQGSINMVLTILILIAALSAHISVNAFNEYADFVSGLDLNTIRTPFSGGSGALPADPSSLHKVKLLAWFTLTITSSIGLYFVYIRGWTLLPLGLTGLVIIISYTNVLTKNAWLCLIAPGFAFGPLFIIGSDIVLTGGYSISAAAASVPVFFLTNNLLLLNQFPDVDADRNAGREHFLIKYSKHSASQLFSLFNILAFTSLIVAIYWSLLPVWALLGVLPASIALTASAELLTRPNQDQILLSTMSKNVAVNLLTPILIAIGVML